MGVHMDASILRKRQITPVRRRGCDAKAGHYEVSRQKLAVAQHDRAHPNIAFEFGNALTELEAHAMTFVESGEDCADLLAELPLEGCSRLSDDRDLEPTFPQARRDLHTDEAGAKDYGTLAALGLRENGISVCTASEQKNIGEIRAGESWRARDEIGRASCRER